MSAPPKMLGLERRAPKDQTVIVESGDSTVMMFGPSVGDDAWAYRVQLTDDQAVLGFPKFFTIGIGFAVETDENTNLPYTSDAEDIAKHIWHNRGDSIPDDHEWLLTVRAAIAIIQNAIYQDNEEA